MRYAIATLFAVTFLLAIYTWGLRIQKAELLVRVEAYELKTSNLTKQNGDCEHELIIKGWDNDELNTYLNDWLYED